MHDVVGGHIVSNSECEFLDKDFGGIAAFRGCVDSLGEIARFRQTGQCLDEFEFQRVMVTHPNALSG